MTTQTLTRPLTEAQIARSVLTDYSLQAVVQKLVALAGVVVVGAIGRVTTSRAVRKWANGESLPTDREAQLRFALRLAMMIAQREPGAVQAWFKGTNPIVDDEAPAMALASDFSVDLQKRLLADVRDLVA